MTRPLARAHRRVSGRRALNHACAWMLVFLVAAPFTSPFSTCDVRALASTLATVAVHPAASLSPGAILVAYQDTDGAPVSIEEETFKDDVVLNDVDLLLAPRAERPVVIPAQAATSISRAPLVALRL